MHIEQTATGCIIRNPSTEIKRKVLQYFSLKQPVREFFIYSGNDPDHPPIFGKERDVLYISSGFLHIIDPVIQKETRFKKTIQPPMGARISLSLSKEPRSDFQRDCTNVMITTKARKLTIEAKPGLGKMEPYSRKIPTPTPDGYTRMGDLKIGDYVFDRNGYKTKVIGIFDHGIQDVYKVTFQDGRTAYCGADHLWTVKASKDGKWKVMQTKEMINDFKKISQWKVEHGREDPYVYKYYIPTNGCAEYDHVNVPVDPYVLGCFIGNGCCTLPALTISSPDAEVPNRIADICGFDVKKKIKRNTEYSYIFYDKTTHKPIHTADFFKDIPSMIKAYSYDKEIPKEYLYNDTRSRIQLLRGLMDTDGSISYNEKRYTVSYSSTSRKLLEQVNWLIRSLGYSGNISNDHRKDKYTKKYCGTLIMRIPNKIKHELFTYYPKYLKALEASSIKQDIIYDDLLIKDISFSHREGCRCIMVDNPEHLYLTEDFIVTHNTFMAMYAISKLGLKPLVITPTTMLKSQWTKEFIEEGIPKEKITNNIYEAPTHDFCVVTITSLENALRDDWNGLMKVIKEANFGIKIIDEAHLHLKGMLRFDAICNIARNWYMSATLGRSDEAEDNILNRALLDAERFVGSSKYEEYQKEYINVYYQDCYYNMSARLCEEYFKYGTKGLIKSTYYNALMAYQNGIPFISNILTVYKLMRHIMPEDVRDKKALILVPMISIIERLVETMKQDSYFNNIHIIGVDGRMKIVEKMAALSEGELIISTSMSMGTGIDIKGMALLINFDQYASPIISEQIVGRNRDRGWECYHVDVVDYVKYAKTLASWGNKRRGCLPYFPGVKKNFKQLPDLRK